MGQVLSGRGKRRSVGFVRMAGSGTSERETRKLAVAPRGPPVLWGGPGRRNQPRDVKSTVSEWEGTPKESGFLPKKREISRVKLAFGRKAL